MGFFTDLVIQNQSEVSAYLYNMLPFGSARHHRFQSSRMFAPRSFVNIDYRQEPVRQTGNVLDFWKLGFELTFTSISAGKCHLITIPSSYIIIICRRHRCEGEMGSWSQHKSPHQTPIRRGLEVVTSAESSPCRHDAVCMFFSYEYLSEVVKSNCALKRTCI